MRTLPVMLRDPNIRIEGLQEMNGGNCVHIVQLIDGVRPFGVWLDPAHDYLPRGIEMVEFPPGKSPRLLHGFDVSEFEKFPDAAGGGDRWFPIRARVRNWVQEIKDFEVTELTINPKIDASRFSIRKDSLPEGVKVTTGSGVSETYTGERRDLWEDRKQLIDAEDRRIALLLRTRIPSPPVGNDATGLLLKAIGAELIGGAKWLGVTGLPARGAV